MGDVIQGSESWFDVRRGLVTASRIPDVISKSKSGWRPVRKNYMAQLIAEILTDTTAESYTSASMRHGIDTEPKARIAYEFYTNSKVEEVGFIKHPFLRSGASPDGLVKDGLIEIKCPNTATHIDYLLSNEPPSKYQPQMLWQMECSGKEWCDFVSYDPRMPEEKSLFIKRFERADKRLDEMREMVVEFIEEMETKIQSLKELKNEFSK